MSKETILDEYRKKFGLCDGSLKYCGCKKELDFISKAIDQTREETIRECEGLLEKITPPYIGVLESNNDRRIYEAGWGALMEETKQSLINLLK